MLWRLIRSFMILTGAIFVGTQALVGIAQIRPYDPLAPYRALMPGQSIDGVEGYPCDLRIGMSKGVEVGFCQFEADDAVFGRVTVVAANRTITRLAFEVEDENLLLGDLVLCWDKPIETPTDSREAASPIAIMQWENQFTASVRNGQYHTQLDYFRPLEYLSTESAWQSCAGADEPQR
jgi:hypothetical protein